MIGQIVFTVIAFVLFIYIVLFKIIKKNDTTYLFILGLQALGILLNFIKITFDIFSGALFTILLYLLCIITPLAVFVLEAKRINVSEFLRITMARTYLLMKNEKKAKKILIDLVSKYKKSYLGHRMLAEIYEKEGSAQKAIDEFAQVLDIKENDYETYYKIAVLLNNLEKKEEAIQMLRVILKNKPDMIEAAKCCGEIYLEQKEFKKAIEIYTNILKHYPNNYEIYYNLGVCYSRINDFDIAKKCFKKTVELNEDMYLAHYRLGQIALLYREYDVAEESFAKSVYNEKEAKAYYELAKIHIMKDQKEKAILDLNNAIRVDSEYYKIMQKEPIFYIVKQSIKKPDNEVKPDKLETKEELELEEYLNDTYNLTKILNSQKNKGISKN